MSVGKVGGSSPKAGVFMPTKDQLISAYRGEFENAVKNGTAKTLKNAPANAEKYPHYNITKPGVLGVDQQAYVIKGKLYVKETPVAPNAKSTWQEVGNVPMF
jgi:hypothetical protein